MADQQTRNALTPDTPENETSAADEHPQPTGKPPHHRQTGTENDSVKHASSRKKTTGELDTRPNHDADSANGMHSADSVNGTEINTKDAHGANDALHGKAPREKRARKKAVDSAASPAVSATGDEAAAPSRKRGTSRKSPSSKKRKTAHTGKQEETGPQETQASAMAEAAAALPVTSKHADTEPAGVEIEPFEPDLEPTPVKARETPPRSLAALEAELDALLSELALAEPPSELEDTMRRPAMRVSPPTPAPAPIAPGESGATEAEQLSIEREIEAEASSSETRLESAPARTDTQPASTLKTLHDIPETPMILAPELAKAPETPLPPVDEEEALAEAALPTTDEETWETLVVEEEIEATVIAVVETPPVAEPVHPAPPAVVAAPQATPEARPRPRRRPLKRVAMLLAFCLCLASSLLLWQNASETHLYLYHFDPANGQLLAQQDLGGYTSISALSNAAQDSSSLFVGISTTPSAQQQVLALAGSDTSWHVAQEFASTPGRSTLSVGPGHLLAVEDSSGLQVLTGDGRALWQVAGDAPLAGAHPFTPAFDGSTVYTITSARRGMVGAYDVRSGAPRWSVQLDDTLNYAPPVLLAGDTLYVAGDHTLYALNTITGGTHWKVAMPARTLLYSPASSPALIAVGPSGLAAFDPQSGSPLWSFNGQPGTNNAARETGTLMTAQFYQASLASDDNTIYATGIVWDTQQLQQQLWLFAVDAGSGKVAWSEPIGTGFTEADAGRVFAPFTDSAHKLVVIEQAHSDGSHTLSAFDTGDGFQRWIARLAAVTASAPALVQVSGGSLGVFSAQNDAGLALRSASRPRLLLLILAISSFLTLLLLWIVPFRGWLSGANRRLHRLPHTLLAPLRALRQLWRFSRLLFAVTLAAILIGASLLTYTQLNQQQPYLRQVGGRNGSALWQHTTSPATTLAGVDGSGALLLTGAADHTFELNALDSNGSSLWRLPSGEGTFTIPAVATQAGTVLAVLRGPSALPYHYAANDPAYPNPLAHYFALYLLDSHTGAIRWHAALASTDALQDFSVLGADAQFIYIAGQAFEQQPVTQLIAVDKTDGSIAWRYYGPREQVGADDAGALLVQGNLVYWQVSGVVYALNPQSGQVEWRDDIPEVNARMASLEEGQMAAGQGVLLIRRSDMYHALDLVTGAERWTLSGLGVDSAQMPGGILADGNRFILYGGGSIEAFDPATQSILWKHINLAGVSNVSLSPDGSMVYAVVLNDVAGGTITQALVAFDANSDLIRWTFQPGAQAQFVYAGARIIYNAGGMIYLATCVASGPGTCVRQVLYGIDEQTGKARWQIQAKRIYALQAGQDGQALTFQTVSSTWENLKALFRG